MNATISISTNEDKLESVKAFLKAMKIKFEISKESDWYDELTTEEKASIERGRKQIATGKGIPHEEVQKRIRKLIESKTV